MHLTSHEGSVWVVSARPFEQAFLLVASPSVAGDFVNTIAAQAFSTQVGADGQAPSAPHVIVALAESR